MFEAAKIYAENMQENDKAILLFEKFLKRFPNSLYNVDPYKC